MRLSKQEHQNLLKAIAEKQSSNVVPIHKQTMYTKEQIMDGIQAQIQNVLDGDATIEDATNSILVMTWQFTTQEIDEN